MRNSKIEVLMKIVFFGAAWGIVEATVGYILHLLPGFIAGSLMFPFVMFILVKAYKSLGDRKAIFYVALVAAAIKSVNLLMPFLPAAKTINPMVSMVLEAALVFAVIPLFDSNKLTNKFAAFAIASVGWRLLFLGYQGLNFALTDFLAAYLKSFSSALEFVLINGLGSVAIMILVYLGFRRVKLINKVDNMKISPLVSLASFSVAILLTIFI